MAAGGQAAGCRDGPVVAGPLPGYEDQVRDAAFSFASATTFTAGACSWAADAFAEALGARPWPQPQEPALAGRAAASARPR